MAESALAVLERAILQVQARQLDFQVMMWTSAASSMYMVSAQKPGDGMGDVIPMVLQRNGKDLLAVFSTPARAADFARSHPYLAARDGFELLRWLPQGVGIVVNPGSAIGFEMEAEGVGRLRSEIEGS